MEKLVGTNDGLWAVVAKIVICKNGGASADSTVAQTLANKI